MAEDLICVRRTPTVEEADIIVAWLAEQGIEATVLDHENPGMMAFGITDHEGAVVGVAGAEAAERAKALLAEHDAAQQVEAEAVHAAVTVDVTCDDCGEVNSFPSDLCGTVQECVECGAYLDVPGNADRADPAADAS